MSDLRVDVGLTTKCKTAYDVVYTQEPHPTKEIFLLDDEEHQRYFQIELDAAFALLKGVYLVAH